MQKYKKLSKLQKQIIKIAKANAFQDTSIPEILHRVYKFPLSYKYHDELRDGKINFAKSELGKEFVSKTVIVSRAFQRLQKRGIAKVWRPGQLRLI